MPLINKKCRKNDRLLMLNSILYLLNIKTIQFFSFGISNLYIIILIASYCINYQFKLSNLIEMNRLTIQ